MRSFFVGKSAHALELSHIHCLKRNGKVLLYEVCYRNGNTVLVSGVKSVKPVLAYNCSGDSVSFLHASDENGLSYFVGKYASGIESLVENHLDTIHPEWEGLLQGRLSPLRKTGVYGPYLTTRWKQTSSNDGQANAYNYYVSSKCDRENRCAAGCVPVAMAQIMHYWKYPVSRSNRKETYDWSDMPDELRYYRNYSQQETNPDYEKERNAIARLLADCGNAANVIYCVSECQSFAWPSDARKARVGRFGYNSRATLMVRSMQASSWKDTIASNIMAGKPVFYAAMNDGPTLEAHAFVCDGYDAGTDMFHFNWGWGGAGAWVSIDEINSGSDQWNNLERAIVNLSPGGSQADAAFSHSGEAMKVWPNPVSGILQVQLPGAEKGIAQLTVRNLLGQIVLQTDCLPLSGLDVSALASGIYLLQLRTVDGAALSARFVRE